jgi:hypothetical protein
VIVVPRFPLDVRGQDSASNTSASLSFTPSSRDFFDLENPVVIILWLGLYLALNNLLLDEGFGYHVFTLRFADYFLFLDLCLRDSSLGESLQVSCEQDGVRPACFFAPKFPEEIANSDVCGRGQAAMLAFAEPVVLLRNLPNVRIDRHSLKPAQTEEADTVSDLWANPLQYKQLFMRLAVALPAALQQLTCRLWLRIVAVQDC